MVQRKIYVRYKILMRNHSLLVTQIRRIYELLQKAGQHPQVPEPRSKPKHQQVLLLRVVRQCKLCRSFNSDGNNRLHPWLRCDCEKELLKQSWLSKCKSG